jgi:hypothetical protein
VIITLPNGETVTATDIPGPGVIVSGTLFSAGGPPITLPNGVILSEAPSGTGIVVIDPATGATSTINYSSVSGLGGPVTTPHPTEGAIITIGGKPYTVIDEGGSMVIPELGITLTYGGPASTINGTVISDAGTGVVVGFTTTDYSTITVSDPTSTSDPNGSEFTAAAARLRGVFGGEWWISGWIAMMMCIGGGTVIL